MIQRPDLMNLSKAARERLTTKPKAEVDDRYVQSILTWAIETQTEKETANGVSSGGQHEQE